MWDLAFSIQIPNLSGLISGFCLGSLATFAACVGLGVWFNKQGKAKNRGIPFEKIEALVNDGQSSSDES